MVKPRLRVVGAGLLTLIALLTIAGLAAAETWTLIWSEGFDDVTDWTLEAHWDNDTPPPQDNQIRVDPGADPGVWLGPTYRSGGTSLWNDGANQILRIQLDNITFADLGAGSFNRQLAWVIADSGVNHIPDAADAIPDWFEVRLLDATCCGVIGWRVIVKDDGVEQAVQDFPIAQFQQGDLEMALFANITINTLINRFWINWSRPGDSGAHTGTWTGDGPFAESDSNQVNFWGYSTLAPLWIDDVALYGNHTDVPGPPPPPPTSGQVHANLRWSITAFGVQFYDKSEAPGRVVEWLWSFGDGYGSRRANPLHEFPCAGRYFVQILVVDEFGNRGDASNFVEVNESTPTCGILQRHEGGVDVKTAGGWINIPQAFFLGLILFSAASIAMGVEFPYLSVRVRILLLAFSILMFSITLGAASLFGV